MASQKALPLRRRARVIALQTLYECDASSHPVEETVERLLKESPMVSDGEAFAWDLVRGTVANLDEINGVIKKYAPAWPVDQIPLVDRGILRIAIFEMAYDHSAPPKVVVNEAVELAKAFGSESSPRFVNGVLGSLMEEKGYRAEDASRRDRG
jgi:N utilization substance protein B